jgi:hypothetical protein
VTAGRVLLLADREVGRHMDRRRDGALAFTRCGDPYDALEAMTRPGWDAVVLTAPRADFEALCRASRRLACGVRLVALCRPVAEPDVRPLAGRFIDDYLIYPPTAGDLAELLQPSPAAPAGPAPGAGLSAEDYGALAEATSSAASVEAAVARLLAERTGAAASWTDADGMTARDEPLLLADGDPPRALAAGGPLPEGAAALLASLQRVLPSLLRVARRTEGLHRLAVSRTCLPGLEAASVSATVAHQPEWPVEACTGALVRYGGGGAMLYEELGYYPRPPWLNAGAHYVFEEGIVSWDAEHWRLIDRDGLEHAEPLPPPAGYRPLYERLLEAVRTADYTGQSLGYARDTAIAQAAYASAAAEREVSLRTAAWRIE